MRMCLLELTSTGTSNNRMELCLENTRGVVRLSIQALITFASLITQHEVEHCREEKSLYVVTRNWWANARFKLYNYCR